MNTRLPLFPLVFLAATPLIAADVTGHWSFDGEVEGRPVQLECDLKQDGAKLSGTCKTSAADVQLAGEVNDPKVRFSYSVDYQGSTYTLYYSGTLESPSLLKGEIGVAGTGGTFTAKRDSADKKPA
jgi:hypothetical protein